LNPPFFILPYKQQTLIGITEMRQSLKEQVMSTSEQEKQYLINS